MKTIKSEITLEINSSIINKLSRGFTKWQGLFLAIILTLVSIGAFVFYYQNGQALLYNDARSHLDIGRRVVEGLKPGIAQLGSVWLPLPHILMAPTIWNDFMWHSGLAGAIISMIAYVATGLLIYKYLRELGASILAQLIAVTIFALNINILYLQSTAMTELLLIGTMMASCYYLLLWFKREQIIDLIKCAAWVMLATLTRYDGWFLLIISLGLIGLHTFRTIEPSKLKNRLHKLEGTLILFGTLAGWGIMLWLLWNQLIFKDALYFAFGPYSAHSQQLQLETAGNLITKGNFFLSIKTYFYALCFNSYTYLVVLGLIGALTFWWNKQVNSWLRLATLALTAPLIFNIIALFYGHSVLFIQGINGDTWFNARYGVMMTPAIAIFIGLLWDRWSKLRFVLLWSVILVIAFSYISGDSVTIDDARVGSSQKNVTEVSSWLYNNAKDKEGFILISAASHDAIIFSSGLSMNRFIHEGTGQYWLSATTNPERWARWIVMRTYDDNDSTWKNVSKTPDIKNYTLVEKYPFADIYQLKDQYLPNLNTKPVLGKQK